MKNHIPILFLGPDPGAVISRLPRTAPRTKAFPIASPSVTTLMLWEFVEHRAVVDFCRAAFSLQGGNVPRAALHCPLRLPFPSWLQNPLGRLGSWLGPWTFIQRGFVPPLPTPSTSCLSSLTPTTSHQWQGLRSAGTGNAEISTVTEEQLAISPCSVYLKLLFEVTFPSHTPTKEK